MAKKKRSRQNKTVAGIFSKRADEAWNELERAFFAAAPPDIALAAPAAERFDDLDEGLPPRLNHSRGRRGRAEVRDAMATLKQIAEMLITAPWLNRRNVTIALASMMLLIGLSAVVFASR
jgi:hypothetical protein